jgi:hypothetical protein
MPLDQVFISYSHEDKKWLDDLRTHLKPYLRDSSNINWSDERTSPASQWFSEINSALTPVEKSGYQGVRAGDVSSAIRSTRSVVCRSCTTLSLLGIRCTSGI